MLSLCVCIDSPGRDPSVITTSSQRSQSAAAAGETGHKALVLKVNHRTRHSLTLLLTCLELMCSVCSRLSYRYCV